MAPGGGSRRMTQADYASVLRPDKGVKKLGPEFDIGMAGAVRHPPDTMPDREPELVFNSRAHVARPCRMPADVGTHAPRRGRHEQQRDAELARLRAPRHRLRVRLNPLDRLVPPLKATATRKLTYDGRNGERRSSTTQQSFSTNSVGMVNECAMAAARASR